MINEESPHITPTHQVDLLPALQEIIEQLFIHPGQGRPIEQVAKMIRDKQRLELWEILKKTPLQTDVFVYQYIPQVGKKEPALIRFSIPSWRGYNEIFWQALGDYLILYLWSVTDVEFHAKSGKITIRYFNTSAHQEKDPDFIAHDVIAKIAYLITNDRISTDFTRFRRMAERKGTVGELPAEYAAALAVVAKMA